MTCFVRGCRTAHSKKTLREGAVASKLLGAAPSLCEGNIHNRGTSAAGAGYGGGTGDTGPGELAARRRAEAGARPSRTRRPQPAPAINSRGISPLQAAHSDSKGFHMC